MLPTILETQYVKLMYISFFYFFQGYSVTTLSQPLKEIENDIYICHHYTLRIEKGSTSLRNCVLDLYHWFLWVLHPFLLGLSLPLCSIFRIYMLTLFSSKKQDLSGRPHLGFDLQIPTERVGTYDTQVSPHFLFLLLHIWFHLLHMSHLLFDRATCLV